MMAVGRYLLKALWMMISFIMVLMFCISMYILAVVAITSAYGTIVDYINTVPDTVEEKTE